MPEGPELDTDRLQEPIHEPPTEIRFLHGGVMAYGRRWPLRAQAVDR